MRADDDPAKRRPEGQQLETPTRIAVRAGKVFDFVSTDGIVRVTFVDTLNVEVSVEEFLRDKAEKKRALSALEQPLERYVYARLTYAGWQRVQPDSPEFAGQQAEIEAKEQEEELKTVVNQLLTKIPEGDIKQEINFLVLSRGGAAEPHMGYVNPVLKNIASDLDGLVDHVISQREHERQQQPHQQRRRRRTSS